MSKQLKALLAHFSVSQKEAEALILKVDATSDEIQAKTKEVSVLKAKIETQKVLDDGKKFDDLGELIVDKTPVNAPIYAQARNHAGVRPFTNFAEQLKAVKQVATTGIQDERLNTLNSEFKNAALGMNENLPEEGGFAVQTDFAGMIMDTAAKSGNILPLVDKYEIGAGSNSVKWVDIDETSVASTVFGGVQVYWAAEAATATATKPKLKEMKMELEKLMGFAYASYELEQDSNFISQLYTKAFTTAITRELESCIISKIGAGIPQSILNNGSLVSVAKETGQAADTILWENIVKMSNRALARDKSVWLINPDVSEQLDFLQFPLGVGGVPVYLSASSIGSIASLKGRPVIETDHCSAIGDKGDIMFADLSEYMLITKGGVLADTSMHVAFLTAENCFRFIFRANGMPKRNTSLTIKNSSNRRSSFVTLDAR